MHKNVGCFFLIFVLLYSVIGLASVNNRPQKNILTLTPKMDISLSDLISSVGYDIDDRQVTSFLREFASLNEQVKSPRLINKGTVVKIPLVHLTKTKTRRTPAPGNIPSFEEKVKSQKVLLKRIKDLLDALNERALVKSGGIRVTSLSPRTRLSFDTTFFPLVEFPDKSVRVMDFRGILPGEMREIIRGAWPNYEIVSGGRTDMKGTLILLLESIGYTCFRDSKVMFGKRPSIEVLTDFMVTKKTADIMQGEMIAISIVRDREQRLPEALIEKARAHGIKIIELGEADRPSSLKKTHIQYLNAKDNRQLSAELLSLLGYRFHRNSTINLSGRKEYALTIEADFAVQTNKGTRIIDFSGLPKQTARYAQQRGIEILDLGSYKNREEIVQKILNFLSVTYADAPRTVSASITPRGVKYRIKTPGMFVRMKNGPFFFTGPQTDDQLLGQLIDRKVTAIKF